MRDYDEKTAREKTETVRKRCFIVPLDEQLAVEAARIKHSLKLALADSIVLGTARSHEARVVTGDKDFKGLPGVVYIGD